MFIAAEGPYRWIFLGFGLIVGATIIIHHPLHRFLSSCLLSLPVYSNTFPFRRHRRSAMISRNPHRCFTTANSTENGDPAVLARNRWMVGVEIREWRGACVAE